MYEYKGELKRVVDGDTLDVVIDLGYRMTTTQRIRLARVNTPEIFSAKAGTPEHEKGMESKNYVEKRLMDNQNRFRIKTAKRQGKYGRYIGEIFLEDSDISLNEELLQKNLAKPA